MLRYQHLHTQKPSRIKPLRRNPHKSMMTVPQVATLDPTYATPLNIKLKKAPRTNPFLSSQMTNPTPISNDPSPHFTSIPRARLLSSHEKIDLLTETRLGCRSTNKTFRFAKIKQFHNMFNPNISDLKRTRWPLQGKWASDYFGNDKPISLELGAGEGHYTVGLAQCDRKNAKNDPNDAICNYIGVDKKGNRLYAGAKEALNEDFTNVAFIRTTFNVLPLLFAKNEVDSIWLTFPDLNYLKNENRHVLSPTYQELFQHILKPGGTIHLKTDQDRIYNFTMAQIKHFNHTVIESYYDLYNERLKDDSDENSEEYDIKTPKDVLAIKTVYEEIWSARGKTIKYIKFKLNPNADYSEFHNEAEEILKSDISIQSEKVSNFH